MNDTQLKSFLEAAKYENFTKAAECMFISQSVLGRQIASLEDELGFLLFNRVRKTVTLTESGRIFRDFLINCEADYTRTIERIKRNLRSEEMKLVLTTLEGQLIAGTYSKAFQHVLDKHVNIDLSIKYFNEGEWPDILRSDAADAAIIDIISASDYPELIDFIPLKSIPNVIVVPAMKYIPNILPDSVKNEKFIIIAPDNTARHSVEAQRRVMSALGITNSIDAPDVSTAAAWVEAGVGITSLPETHRLCSSALVNTFAIPENISPPVTEVYAWHRNNTNPAVAKFGELLKKLYSAE